MVPEMTALAVGEDPGLRHSALRAFGLMGGEEGRRGLAQAAERFPGEAVREFGPAGFSVAEILRHVGDSRPEVRFAAIETLGSSKEPAAAERALWSLLEREGDANARRLIVSSIGGVGSRATVQLLEAYRLAHPEQGGEAEGAKERIFRRLLGM
jgi:HEAT repeat protein